MRTYSWVVAATLLLMQAVPALAADGYPGAAPERRARFEQWCRENAEPCKELQERREQCKADPERCRAEMLARMKEHQAQCMADPEKCKAELQARREQWCKANPEPCKELQARREQCKANPEQCRAEMQARVQERFNRADTNGDGRISREEAEKGMPGLARYFDRIDADKDGTVTLEELQAARKALAGQRRGPGSSLQPAKPT